MSIAVGVIGLAITIGQIIEDSFSFSDNCRQLKERCGAIQAILRDNELIQLPAIAELETQIQKCEEYLESCKKRRFVRNPVFEVTFHRKIGKYVSAIDSWIIIATLALVVFHRCETANTHRGETTPIQAPPPTTRLVLFQLQKKCEAWKIKA